MQQTALPASSTTKCARGHQSRRRHPQRIATAQLINGSRVWQPEPWACCAPQGRCARAAGRTRRALGCPPSAAAADASVAVAEAAAADEDREELSVEDESLEILEWPAVCRQVACFCRTPVAAEYVQAGLPLGASREESERLLQQTQEAADARLPLEGEAPCGRAFPLVRPARGALCSRPPRGCGCVPPTALSDRTPLPRAPQASWTCGPRSRRPCLARFSTPSSLRALPPASRPRLRCAPRRTKPPTAVLVGSCASRCSRRWQRGFRRRRSRPSRRCAAASAAARSPTAPTRRSPRRARRGPPTSRS